MTRSAKKDLTELLQKCLKILYGWPLVELKRNSFKQESRAAAKKLRDAAAGFKVRRQHSLQV